MPWALAIFFAAFTYSAILALGTTKTVYEPKTTQEVSYEKEPYTGQLPCANCTAPAPAPVPVVQAPTLTVPASAVVTVPAPMPEAQMVSEITMDPAEIK